MRSIECPRCGSSMIDLMEVDVDGRSWQGHVCPSCTRRGRLYDYYIFQGTKGGKPGSSWQGMLYLDGMGGRTYELKIRAEDGAFVDHRIWDGELNYTQPGMEVVEGRLQCGQCGKPLSSIFLAVCPGCEYGLRG